MEMKVIKDEKESIEVEFKSITLVEILKVYLNKDSSVEFAAWRREHPTENPILAVRTKGKTAKKAINDAVSVITKELDVIQSDFKKLK